MIGHVCRSLPVIYSWLPLVVGKIQIPRDDSLDAVKWSVMRAAGA